ncbi:serine hydroxymethyltransferase 2, mitochondrial-like [Hibiscus syriacus]|uniref:serine hydroxymethyltransferase 2, mitochondrial-like n=1 Tax=Hibiscus syriacus TaxID=106335 RepID=UPI001924AD04|nr:serine hydroxymethyltransferase 2, mitochondrial-like [Hibiscus syriacus]
MWDINSQPTFCFKSPIRPLFSRTSLRFMSTAAAEKEKALANWVHQLNAPLEEIDPEIANIIELEKAWQWKMFTF